jgi:hypothetical protein
VLGGQRVTQRSDFGAVELGVVLGNDIRDRHVHQAVAGERAGARTEDDPGRVGPEQLVGAEALPRCRGRRDRARFRIERRSYFLRRSVAARRW